MEATYFTIIVTTADILALNEWTIKNYLWDPFKFSYNPFTNSVRKFKFFGGDSHALAIIGPEL